MKKSRFLAYLIAGACACMTLTACGSDDDDDVPENPSDTNNPTATAGPHTVYATLDGNKVTLAKLGSYSFSYNSENYAVDIAGSKMSYDSGKIIFPDGKTGNLSLTIRAISMNWSLSTAPMILMRKKRAPRPIVSLMTKMASSRRSTARRMKFSLTRFMEHSILMRLRIILTFSGRMVS